MAAMRRLFVGTFDNREQATEAAANGTPTAREGGHEFITVRVDAYGPASPVLVATYFLDGDPKKTFRYRFYEFREPCDTEQDFGTVMSISRPMKPAMDRLRACEFDRGIYLPLPTEMEYLPACDIGWCQDPSGEYFTGELVGDGNLASEADPTRRIQVYDSLQLGQTSLLINDRVYDQAAGEQLIGNIHGTPYKLQRRC
jgi:hypothetical protein